MTESYWSLINNQDSFISYSNTNADFNTTYLLFTK